MVCADRGLLQTCVKHGLGSNLLDLFEFFFIDPFIMLIAGGET